MKVLVNPEYPKDIYMVHPLIPKEVTDTARPGWTVLEIEQLTCSFMYAGRVLVEVTVTEPSSAREMLAMALEQSEGLEAAEADVFKRQLMNSNPVFSLE